VVLGQFLQRRKTRLTDGFPITGVVLLQSLVPDQYVDISPSPTSTGATMATPQPQEPSDAAPDASAIGY